MESKKEQALVGIFVIVAIAILLIAMFSISGFFNSSGNLYHAYFKNAGGLQEGGQVRYAGGPPIGRILSVKPDPKNVAQMQIEFRVEPDVPVKKDSTVKISSLSALGENFLLIVPGSQGAPLAQNGDVIQTGPYTSLDDIEATIGDLAPQAKILIANLNDRVGELKETIADVNDLLNARNRENIAGVMSNANKMLEEDRPLLNSTLKNANDATAKIGPILDDFKGTLKKTDDAITHVDSMLTTEQPEIHASLLKLHETLNSTASLTDQIDRTLNVNSPNLDEILENMRQISENLKEFTETIKTRPYTLIRSSEPKPRQPGEAPPP
jgi:phospholipid/cholesterol/gamma-HCH transport system substrate-binding protein